MNARSLWSLKQHEIVSLINAKRVSLGMPVRSYAGTSKQALVVIFNLLSREA